VKKNATAEKKGGVASVMRICQAAWPLNDFAGDVVAGAKVGGVGGGGS